VWTTTAYR